MSYIRQGKCEFADYDGRKHQMTWTVGIDGDMQRDQKHLIKKTNIWKLLITIDGERSASFEDGRWNKRPPLFGVARDAYKVILTLYH